MPRRPRPPHTSRSEHWLRVAVNDRPALLEAQLRRAFGFSADESFTWLSPIAGDEYAEYYDQAFIDRLGIVELDVPLHEFWPPSGPRWDGLAKTSSGKYILIEAKAYVEEAVDYRSSAGESSMLRISAALQSAKVAYSASEKGAWDRPFYQYANRLAHLHFLRGLNRRPAYLAFVCFANAPDVPGPCSPEMWIGAQRVMNKALGISKHEYSQFLAHVLLDVRDLTPAGRPRAALARNQRRFASHAVRAFRPQRLPASARTTLAGPVQPVTCVGF